MFKPGRMYIYNGGCGNGPNFYIGVAYKAHSKNELFNARDIAQTINHPNHFVEVQQPKQEQKKDMCDSYEFNVSSEQAIDLEEVAKCLTRTNPLVIVKRSDGLHTVLIHNSVVQKVMHIDPMYSTYLENALKPYAANTWIPLQHSVLTPVVDAVRCIKAAQYTNRKQLKCQVDLVAI